jgi:hypothetical protein
MRRARNRNGHRLRNFISLLCVLFATVASATNWNPTTLDWSCATQQNSEVLCSLIAEGPAPTLADPVEATATYRILKGRVLGAGQVLLTSVAKMPCRRLVSGSLRCEAINEVRLAAGIAPVYGVSPPTTLLTIYSDTPGPLFDWDGDGRITADREGVLLNRYLMGFRGGGLVDGVSFSDANYAAVVQSRIQAGLRNDWFQFSSQIRPPDALRDSVIFKRCVSGVTGTSLIAGTGTTDPTVAANKCAELLVVQ